MRKRLRGRIFPFFGASTDLLILSVVLGSSLLAQGAPDLAKATKGLNEWRGSREAMLMDDFGELARYREANAKLDGS